jgi:hypothetical protein
VISYAVVLRKTKVKNVWVRVAILDFESLPKVTTLFRRVPNP